MGPEIISISRRTDIPAFFTPWLMHRVRDGFVMVRNPRNPKQVLRVSLHPEDVVAIVFWSRDYGRLLAHLPELDDRGFRACFHLTLTGYGPPLELRNPKPEAVLSQFEALAARYGRERIIWRYDPIVLGSEHTLAFHEKQFESLARQLGPLSARCIISYLDPYPSTRRQLGQLSQASGEQFSPPTAWDRRELGKLLQAIGTQHHLDVSACCEAELGPEVPAARCIDAELIGSFTDKPQVVFRPAPTRKGCGCVHARDIGAYHTCAHGCLYCYANESPEVALRNASAVEPHANHLGQGQLQASRPSPRQLSLEPRFSSPDDIER